MVRRRGGTQSRQIFWSRNGAPANIVGHRWNANTEAFRQITSYSLGWPSISLFSGPNCPQTRDLASKISKGEGAVVGVLGLGLEGQVLGLAMALKAKYLPLKLRSLALALKVNFLAFYPSSCSHHWRGERQGGSGPLTSFKWGRGPGPLTFKMPPMPLTHIDTLK